jgi:hypothetical protein
MAKQIDFAKFRNALRVVTAVRRVTMDANREALHEAENDLDALKALKMHSSDFVSKDGQTVDELIAAKLHRIQDLRHDLHEDC